MGSSFAAGPFVGARSPGSPRPAGRSAENYAHLLARRLGLDLTDVTYSGVTAAELLDGTASGEPPQIEAVTPETALVTVTCGGNDVGYLPRLTLAGAPWPIRALPGTRRQVAELGRLSDAKLSTLDGVLDRLTAEIRRRAPRARLFLVDYLTILPPAGVGTGLLPPVIADWGRQVAGRLAAETAAAAERAGCGYIAASAASVDHHAWAPEPWTRRFRISPRGGAPYHPNAAGMRAVASLLADAVGNADAATGGDSAGR
jgi:lysophospholipase L1-like esterase